MDKEKLISAIKNNKKEILCFGLGYVFGMLGCYRRIHKGISKFING